MKDDVFAFLIAVGSVWAVVGGVLAAVVVIRFGSIL